jgi:hypothetical protein
LSVASIHKAYGAKQLAHGPLHRFLTELAEYPMTSIASGYEIQIICAGRLIADGIADFSENIGGIMKKLVVVAAVVALSGCASITGSKLQPVSVQTVQDNKEVAGAGCTLTNDAGKWFVTTPGSVTIQKSTGDLAVDCTKETVSGHENVVSKANGGVWGNIIAGGGIGYIIDRNTGAGFDYPTQITVMLHKLGEAVGLLAPSTTAAPPSVTAAAATPPAAAAAEASK